MSFKKSPDWKGKIQQVLTDRKPKFKEKKIHIKQAKTNFCILQFVGKEGVYRSRFFSEVKLTNMFILCIN